MRSLKRELHTAGYNVFVNNFDLFKICSKSGDISKCISHLVSNGTDKDEGGARRRYKAAKDIFDRSLQCEALRLVIESRSRSVSEDTKKEARRLRKQYCKEY